MGRNKKNGLDYFPFDIDLFQDIRIRKLIKYQSGKAVTVYTLLLCIIYKDGYYMRWDKELPFIISEQTGFEEAYILEVINSCLKLGLFHNELYVSDGILTSKGIQERYKKICDLCRRNSEISEFSLISSEEKIISSEEKPINSAKSTQSKSKVKKKKELLSSESNKKNEPKGSPLTPSHPGFNPDLVEKPLDECKKILEANIAWIETVCMQQYISTSQFKDYLDEFFKDMACRDVGMKSPKDARSHFASWLKINLRIKSNENSNGTCKQDRDTDRKSKLAGYFQEAFSDCGKSD
ncbi:DUF4373 domain-containing protein [Parabacteroides distasonis]|jgi:hypothetical protein|nr:DUF4373 domain-containing protein [Parabacteroides distasonis]MCE8845825.1 DUF4373 domain-containing protein [Parabacteroides distasonis]MCE9025647.1 DUF4373 domain-containing protein [Parabacteroides distasonis]